MSLLIPRAHRCTLKEQVMKNTQPRRITNSLCEPESLDLAPGKSSCERVRPSFGPLVQVCAAYGIRRSRAFDLAKKGLLDHFAIGRSRFFYIESV